VDAVERGSDKHGSKLDEEMKKETQSIEKGAPTDSRVEEHKKKEEIEEEEEEG
jgi:hypothetical protein